MKPQLCVYILASPPHGTRYIGVASNLLARLIQRRAAAFKDLTARYDMTRLVWYETVDTREAAVHRERQLGK